MQNHDEDHIGNEERPEIEGEGVGYGWLAFDNFVFEKWNWEAPVSTDAQQWAVLVAQYNSLQPVERMQYHLAAYPATRTPAHPPLPPPAFSARALAPFQTPLERVTTSQLPHKVLWLRTNYDPSLAARYDDLFGWVAPGIPEVNLAEPGGVLDNAALYDFEDSATRTADRLSYATVPGLGGRASNSMAWRQVFLRFPELCDGNIREVDEEGYEMWEWEDHVPAERRAVTYLFLVDEEAIRGGWVKVLWLNEHGACVWDNKVRPDDLISFTGAYSSVMMDMLDGNEVRGAILEW